MGWWLVAVPLAVVRAGIAFDVNWNLFFRPPSICSFFQPADVTPRIRCFHWHFRTHISLEKEPLYKATSSVNGSGRLRHALSKDNTDFTATYSYIHKQNEPYLPQLPSHKLVLIYKKSQTICDGVPALFAGDEYNCNTCSISPIDNRVSTVRCRGHFYSVLYRVGQKVSLYCIIIK